MPMPLPPPPPQRDWRILDPVLRLRVLETDELHPLPAPREGAEVVLGAGAAASLQLRDPTRQLSRRHAGVAWDGRRWIVRDLESKNGLWIDGVRRTSAALAPGLELGLGGLTLVAESAELLRLRALVERLLGWSAERRPDVDRALRALRDAALLRASLVLCGDGDLVPIARRLHRETLGAARPFVACGRRDRARELLQRAGDGTLCISAAAPPLDALDAIGALFTTPSPARIVLCAPDARAASPLGVLLEPTVWLELPPLARRRDELPRLLAEAVAEAARELDRPLAALRRGDVEQLAEVPFEGLAGLHDAARHLVALRALGASAGAAHLGVAPGALSRWARRRGLAA